MKPKNPSNKKYGFCEYRSNEDMHWNLALQKENDKKSKEAVLRVSRRFATKYQLEQLALHQLKEQQNLKNTSN